MPRKATARKSTKSSTKSSTKKSKAPKTVKTPKADPVKEEVAKKEEVVVVEEVSDVEATAPAPKKRRVPTRETVLADFDNLVLLVEEEVARLRESQTKAKGVKFLRSLGKKVKTLRNSTSRVMKQKHRTNRKNNTNSGFLKPVKISKEMAKFTGWDPEELKSRVAVTKHICKYIKDNDLQNPEDRRQILPNKALAKLLKYDPKKADKPLTYYSIQSHMKGHFLK